MMGYSVDGVMGYKIYIPELKEIVIGVNCLIPTYSHGHKKRSGSKKIPSNRSFYLEAQSKKFVLSMIEDLYGTIGVKYF